MDPITYTLNEIEYRIPKFLLKLVFGKLGYPDYRTGIIEQVISGRVITNLNIHGYNKEAIPISLATITHKDSESVVYHFKSRVLNNKEIISSYGAWKISNILQKDSTSGNNDGIKGAINTLKDTNQKISPIHNITTRVVAKNTIAVYGKSNLSTDMHFKVSLGDNSDLNSFQPKSLKVFTDLVELAVKSFIVNNYDIESSLTPNYGGVEVTGVRNKVDEYSDAEVDYQELLKTKWGKISLMNDGRISREIIRKQITGLH